MSREAESTSALIEDSIEAAREYAHEAPGLLFGAYRRQVAIKRAARVMP